MADDFWDEFETFSDEDAPEFKFQATGDAIVGIIKQQAKVDTRFGRKVKMTVETKDGLRTVWPNQAQLIRRLGEVKPSIGDKIGIKLVGEEDTGKGNPAKIFEVKFAAAKDAKPEPAPPPPDEEEFSDEPF